MQNWNQWQLPSGGVTASMPQPPVGYATPGADPAAMMQAYMQYYNQPAPSGYTPEQWAAAQQQNWAQWQQWQQQYQQWQAQYGDKYQETMKQMSAQGIGLSNQAPPLPTMQPPPLPKDDAKPPLPPSTHQFTTMPPPHQNNLPLFPTKQSTAVAPSQTNVSNCPQNPPLPSTQPPLPPDMPEGKDSSAIKRSNTDTISDSSAKKSKLEEEDLSEAEKTFDAQFKQWEEQFNKWKQQNMNHPDKTQYKEYEAKWTSWREKLIERRELMRKKREQQKQAAAKAEFEKKKGLPEGEKIMNILSSTENQGLINNLLGIGKSLGLTGKQNALPPPPPPPPQTSANVQGTNTISSTSQQSMSQAMASGPPAGPWSTSQWPNQYTNDTWSSGSSGFFGAQPTQNTSPNFTQPPPNVTNATPNFSQPPPGFATNQNLNKPMQQNMQDRSSFGRNANKSFGNERTGPGSQNIDSDNHPSNFGANSGPKSSDFGRDTFYKNSMDSQNNQIRPNDSFAPRNDYFNRDSNFRRNDEITEGESFKRDDKNYSGDGNQFNSPKGDFSGDRFGSGNDRFGPGNDRFGTNSDRYGPNSDRFGLSADRFGPDRPDDRFRPPGDRFGPENDRFPPGNNRLGSSNERFGPGNNRFGPGNDRFGPGNDRFETNRFNPGNDRFGSGQDRFGPNNEPLSSGGDRFGRNNANQFDQKDGFDRRDSFGNNSRFGRGNQFEPKDELAPELKKLMEKRKAAGDVFKPSFFTDTDRTSNVGSLSESFKKIAGNLPFMSRNNNDMNQRDNIGMKGNFGLRGPGGFAPSNSDIRPRGPNDFRLPDFGPRGPGFGPRGNAFDLPGIRPDMMKPGHILGNEFEPRNIGPTHMQDISQNAENLEGNSMNNDNVPTGKAPEFSEQTNQLITDEKQELINSNQNLNNASVQKKDPQESSVQREIAPLEKPPWVDAQFSEGNLTEKEINVREDDLSNTFMNAVERTSDDISNVQTVDNDTNKDDTDNSFTKKPEVLPFMGENDPKPEDLNMEPPPELPNLGPISMDMNNEQVVPRESGENSYDVAGPNSRFAGPPRPNDGSFGPRSFNDVPPFGPPSTHTGSFGPRNLNDTSFGPPGPDRSFGPGPSDRPFGPPSLLEGPFGPRGPSDGVFRPRDSDNGPFGPRGPNNNLFGPRGLDAGPFGQPRGSNDGSFGSRGPTDIPFRPRGPNDGPFGLRGPIDGPFGQRSFSDNPFGQQRGPKDGPFGPRGPNDGAFGSRGTNNAPFAPRGPNDGPFAPKNLNDGPFAPRGPTDSFGRNPTDIPFSPRGPRDGPRDGPFGPGTFNDRQFNIHEKGNSSFAPGPPGPNDRPFRPRGLLDAPFAPRDLNDESYTRNQNLSLSEQFSKCDFRSRDSFSLNTEPKNIEPRFNNLEANDFRNKNKDMDRPAMGNMPIIPHQQGAPEVQSSADSLSQNMQRRPGSERGPEKYPFDPNDGSRGGSSNDCNKLNSPDAFMKRTMDRPVQSREAPNKEFCIERQFNYNHGNINAEKKYAEHAPMKVIDYCHTHRTVSQDYLTPVQCFDYGHGTLKPVVPDHETYPQKDFRNWEENEQNLKDYTEGMKRYENFVSKREPKRNLNPMDRSHGRVDRISDRYVEDRKYDKYERYERERKEKNDFKEWDDYKRDHQDRRRDNTYEKNQEDRYKKNEKREHQDKPQEKCEWSQKDTGKEKDKDDDRSKGNINWQEGLNKNISETKTQDTSATDKQHNVPETSPKTLELPKPTNCTMVDDLLCPPGRQTRPPKIAIILRGPPGSGKSFVAKLIKDKEVEQGGSAPRILSLDDYFLIEKEIETKDDNGKKITTKDMVYEYEEVMEPSYIASLVKAFKKNITDGYFNFIILDSINEKISDYEEMWSFAKTKGFKVYVCEMEMDVQICLKRNIHNRSEDEINRIIDYFEPTPSYHQKLDVNSMLQEQAIEEVYMEDSQATQGKASQPNEDSQDSQEDIPDSTGVSKWERMEVEDKLDRLDGLAKRKNEGKPQTMEDFLQVPDYYNMEDTSGKKRVRWADLEERKEQEKMRAVGFVVGHTNWDRMMDPTNGGSALTRTKFFSLS